MNAAGEREKQSAATTSVVAAVGLTTLKLLVGVATGSLGILAEAAHSGLDLVAALLTWFAIRIAARPPDRSHLYGHGKIENLSALAETLLLLITCAWIVYEAVHRMAAHRAGDVEVSFWSFAIMITSVVVDISRSRVLKRAAVKYNSQALEADALHFETDVWSSAVVILGLIGVLIARSDLRLGWLAQADAVAALLVAAIVVWVSVRLGIRTVNALLDTAPSGIEDRVTTAVSAMEGVRDCHHVRVRASGPVLFIDLHVLVDGSQSLAATHALTDQVEELIRQLLPGADVTVHPEPDDRMG